MVRASVRRVLRAFRRRMESPTVDAVIRWTVVLSLPLGGFAVYQVTGLTDCVATYNNANNARSKALVEATDDERTAERKADDAQAALFLSPVLSKPKRTPVEQAEVLRLFRAYQEALSAQRTERADADDARRDHPIPDPPSQVCG